MNGYFRHKLWPTHSCAQLQLVCTGPYVLSERSVQVYLVQRGMVQSLLIGIIISCWDPGFSTRHQHNNLSVPSELHMTNLCLVNNICMNGLRPSRITHICLHRYRKLGYLSYTVFSFSEWCIELHIPHAETWFKNNSFVALRWREYAHTDNIPHQPTYEICKILFTTVLPDASRWQWKNIFVAMVAVGGTGMGHLHEPS